MRLPKAKPLGLGALCVPHKELHIPIPSNFSCMAHALTLFLSVSVAVLLVAALETCTCCIFELCVTVYVCQKGLSYDSYLSLLSIYIYIYIEREREGSSFVNFMTVSHA